MKNLKAVIILFVANSISGIAQGISMLAIPWYFAQENLLGTFGLIYILSNIIALFWVPYAGTLVDRFNRKGIFLVLTIFCGLMIGGISAFGFHSGTLPWWLVASAFMLTFLNYSIHYPNLYAFVQEIVETRFYGRITSYMEIQGQLTTMLAGAGGAILLEGTPYGRLNIFGFLIDVPFDIRPWPMYEILALDAATYFVAFAILSLMTYTAIQTREEETGTVFSRLLTGLKYLHQNRSVMVFGMTSYMLFVTVLVSTFYLNAIYVDNHLLRTGDVFATEEMYYAIGAVFAGVMIRHIFFKTSIPMAVLILLSISIMTYFWLFVSDSVIVFYLSGFLIGVTNAGTRILRVTYLFRVIPNQVYGRANSVFGICNIIFRIILLGIFAIPFFHAGNNIIYAFLFLGIFLMITIMIMRRDYRKFMRLNPS